MTLSVSLPPARPALAVPTTLNLIDAALRQILEGLAQRSFECDHLEAARQLRQHAAALTPSPQTQRAHRFAARIEGFLTPCVHNGGMVDKREQERLGAMLVELVSLLSTIHDEEIDVMVSSHWLAPAG
ncbi:MAG: hypothetical protein AAGA56_10020 [Myxococcota bacterium]